MSNALSASSERAACQGSERCMCRGFIAQRFRRLVCVDCFHGKSAHSVMATPNKHRHKMLAKSADAFTGGDSGDTLEAQFSPRTEDAVASQRQDELLWQFLRWTREWVDSASEIDPHQGKRLNAAMDSLEMNVMRYTEGKVYTLLSHCPQAAKNGAVSSGAASARSLIDNMKKSPANTRTRGSRRAHSSAAHTEGEARRARNKKKGKRLSTALSPRELQDTLQHMQGDALEVLLEASKAKELVQQSDPDKLVLTVLLPDSQFASVVLSLNERAVDALLKCCAKRGLDSSNYMLVDNESGAMLPNTATADQLRMCTMLSLKAKPKAVLRSDRKRLEKEMKSRVAGATAQPPPSLAQAFSEASAVETPSEETRLSAPVRRPMQADSASEPVIVEKKVVRRAQPAIRTVVEEEVNDLVVDSEGIDLDAAMAALANASSEDSSNMFVSSSEDVKQEGEAPVQQADPVLPRQDSFDRVAHSEKSPRADSSPRPSLFALWGGTVPAREKSPRPSTLRANFGSLLNGVDALGAMAKLAPDNWTKLVGDWGVVDEMNLKGLKRAKKKMSQNVDFEMQDAEHCEVPFAKNSNMALFSVFDGHAGKECALQAAKLVPKCIRRCMREQLAKGVELKDMRQVFISAFALAEESLKVHMYEGCTGTVALLWAIGGKRYLQAANVGDSHAFLGRNSNAIQLTVEHKIGDPRERARVEAEGVFVEEGASRLSGLAVSRALGDYYLKEQGAGVSGVPSVSDVYPITGSDQYLIVASDGLWDTITGQDALHVIHGNNERSAQQLCELLLAQAVASPKCTDNITIAVVNLREQNQ